MTPRISPLTAESHIFIVLNTVSDCYHLPHHVFQVLLKVGVSTDGSLTFKSLPWKRATDTAEMRSRSLCSSFAPSLKISRPIVVKSKATRLPIMQKSIYSTRWVGTPTCSLGEMKV